jgi:hypothetical protein
VAQRGQESSWLETMTRIGVGCIGVFCERLAPERWLLILGACFGVSVAYARGGVVPHLLKRWDRMLAARESGAVGATVAGSGSGGTDAQHQA